MGSIGQRKGTRSNRQGRVVQSNPSFLCHCGKASVLRTSWIDLNPGRRFLGCEMYEANGGRGFFAWVDLEMCQRSTVVIPGLLRRMRKLEDDCNSRIRKLENDCNRRKRKEQLVWKTLVAACLITLVALFCKI